MAANVWSAPTSFPVNIGGRAITCATGTHGFNAITNTCDPLDDNDHGSHTSGTIGAVGNNGVGVVGVNWTASIMGITFLDVLSTTRNNTYSYFSGTSMATPHVAGADARALPLRAGHGGCEE